MTSPTRPTAIVTGGSQGFGLALVVDLAEHGWTVITDARNRHVLDRAIRNLPRALTVPGDVNDPAHRAALIEAARAATGRLDLLVNNAGTLGPSPLPSLSTVDPAALHEVFNTNVVAPLALTQLALPMLRRAGGAVVNLTSDASVEAYEGWGAYGSSKAALDQLTRVFGVENPDVRFWALDPGDLRTPMHQLAFPGEDISDRPLPETAAPAVRALLDARPPSGRLRATDLRRREVVTA